MKKQMILCDTNVWLALALSGHRFHKRAREWLGQQKQSNSIYFCRSTQQSFLRLLTNPKLLNAYGNKELTNLQAWGTYEALLKDFRIEFMANEPRGLEEHWQEYAVRESSSSKLWMDAYLAAFARAADLELVTIDRGFRQFKQLKLCLLEL